MRIDQSLLHEGALNRCRPPLKVLHVFDHSIPYFSGYTFRSGYILANQRKLGFETMVLTSCKHEKQTALHETLDGQAYYRTPPFTNRLSRAAYHTAFLGESIHMQRLYRRIRQVYDEERFDLIHAHSPALNGYPAIRFARKVGIPVVYEIRAFWEDAGVNLGTYQGARSLKYRSVRRFETHLCKRADAVTTICNGLKEDLLSRGIDASRITVIPNCVQTDRFLPAPRDAGLMERYGLKPGRVLGFIGSFYDYEGLDLLLEAFVRIRKERNGVKLLLVGGGYQGQSEQLKNQARHLGLDGSCIFTGRVPHEEVRKYYSVIDLLVYPRRSTRVTELVTPLKPLEAMSMEKVVLGSSVGGIAELVEDGKNGFLFEPDSPQAIAQIVSRVLGDPDQLARIGPNSRRYVEENRSWEKAVGRYEAVYRSALERCLSRG